MGEWDGVNDPRSTNEIRLIAQDVTRQQAEVCGARRDALTQQMTTLFETVKSNAASVASLTVAVTSLVTTVTPLAVTARENAVAIAKLKGRPAAWAAIGAALPTLLGVLLWWFSR